MSVFEDTINEVSEQKAQETAGESVGSTAPPAEATQTDTQDPTVESQAAGEGARAENESSEAEQTTEEEISLTGLESPEDLERAHGADWSAKTSRRVLPLVKQAGGMQNLRLSAELAEAIRNPEATGPQILEKIQGLSETRAQEIQRDIFWATLDLPKQFEAVLQDKLQAEFPDTPLTLDFIKQAISNEIQYSAPQNQAVEDGDYSQLSPTQRKRLEDYDRMMSEFPQLQQKVTGFEERQKSEAQRKAEEEIQGWGYELRESVFSVVEERKKELGLEIKPTDSDEVKDLKQDLLDYLSEDRLETMFEADTENLRQSRLALSYLSKRDKATAFSYAPVLQIGALRTLEQALKDPRTARKLGQLKSVMESEATPKNPTARPEMVQGTNAGFSATDPFEEAGRDGRSPFDISVELAGRAPAR